MSSPLKVERLTQELFDQFQSLYYFISNEDTPGYNQGLLDMSTYSYVFLVNNVPIACFGLFTLWKGVGECWLMGSPELHKYSLSVIKVLRDLTNQLLSVGMQRIQIYVNNTDQLNKWARLLGFTFEGILHNHSIDGRDNAIYAKWL
jgi:hypothetical protein